MYGYRRYAQDTEVSSDRSRNEIEGLLRKYGASAFAYGWKDSAAIIQFELHDRRIKFVLPLPSRDEDRFQKTATGRVRRNAAAPLVAWEQECRSRWRGLALAIKAKLQSAADGIESFEEAFFAQIVLPGGKTVGESLLPQVKVAYETGKVPRLLLGVGGEE